MNIIKYCDLTRLAAGKSYQFTSKQTEMRVENGENEEISDKIYQGLCDGTTLKHKVIMTALNN